MSRPQWLCLAAGLVAFALVPLGLRSYGLYLATLWCVYLMAGDRAQPDRRLCRPDVDRPCGVFRHRRLCGRDPAEGRHVLLAGIAGSRDRLFYRRARPRLSGVTGPAPLPRFRDARLQRPGLSVLPQRGVADRRYLRPLRHPATDRCSDLRSTVRWTFFYFVYASTLGPRRRVGRGCCARPGAARSPRLRDNPIRAESLGVNITAYTLLAFAIGAAYAGIAGVYFAALVQYIEPGPFIFSPR